MCAYIATSPIRVYTAGLTNHLNFLGQAPPIQTRDSKAMQVSKVIPYNQTLIFDHIAQSSTNHKDHDLMGLGSTPIKLPVLAKYLVHYPKIHDVQLLLNRFTSGFYLNYAGPREFLQPKNMKSASEHVHELLSIIEKKITLGRMAGPLPTPLQILGVILLVCCLTKMADGG